MKTTIIALSAAALIAAAPAALAQDVPEKVLGLQYKISKKHHRGVSGYAPLREIQTMGSKKGYSGAFGYAANQPSRLDRNLEASRQAGGGGGSGGSGM
ncbi:hypothetical protein ACKWRH_40485 [Bradyrhizobium sp. Pa8]|uniref:hypothetical protein n=1 Tax=Bradyrhizobium sp. Pa8 TaxID=3386552 RepID=UPI00403F99B5